VGRLYSEFWSNLGKNFKMALGTEVGLGPGQVVLDADPAHCKAVAGLATFSARVVIYLMLIRRAGT